MFVTKFEPYYEGTLERWETRTEVWFREWPRCDAAGDSPEEAIALAKKKLESRLVSEMAQGAVPCMPRQGRRIPARTAPIEVRPALWIAMSIRWERTARGLTQAALAQIAGVSQQQVAKLEDPHANPRIATLEKVADAFGLTLRVGFYTITAP